MRIKPNELSSSVLEALSDLAEASDKNLPTALREAVDTWLRKHEPHESITNSNSKRGSIEAWEAYFANSERPTVDFMKERIDPPPEKLALF